MKHKIFIVSLLLMLVFISGLPAQKSRSASKDEKLSEQEEIFKSDKTSSSKAEKDASIIKEIFRAVNKSDDKPAVQEKEKSNPAPRRESERQESYNYEKPLRNDTRSYEKPSQPKPDRNPKPVQKESAPTYQYPDRNSKPDRTEQTYKENYFQPVPQDYYRTSTRNREKPVVTDRDTRNRTNQDYTYKQEAGQRAQTRTAKPETNNVTRTDKETQRTRNTAAEVLPDRKTDANPSRAEYKLVSFSGETASEAFSVTNDISPTAGKPERPVERFRTPVTPPTPHDSDDDTDNHHPGHGDGDYNHNWNYDGNHQGGGHHNHHNYWSYDYNPYHNSWWDWDYWNRHQRHHRSYWTFGISFWPDWDYWNPYYYGSYYYPVYGWSGWYPYSYYTWYNPHLHTWRTWHYSYIRPVFYYSLTYREEITSFTGYLVRNSRINYVNGTSGLQSGNGRRHDNYYSYCDSDCPRRGYGIMVKMPDGERVFYHLDNYGNRLARKVLDRYGRQNRKLLVEVRGVLDEDTHTIITYSLKRVKWYKTPTVALHFYYGPFWHRPFRWF
jgi:hypothetical protein